MVPESRTSRKRQYWSLELGKLTFLRSGIVYYEQLLLEDWKVLEGSHQDYVERSCRNQGAVGHDLWGLRS